MQACEGRSRGFRRNPIRASEGQHREDFKNYFDFFVETTNRPYRKIRMYSPIPRVIVDLLEPSA